MLLDIDDVIEIVKVSQRDGRMRVKRLVSKDT